ncbi:MAG: site-specific DNA-methyltransferase, partial [Selenomonadaceae bacterium]|nr:site-specific DNA-methyltransferase [Selenomonadaceae bacterium]
RDKMLELIATGKVLFPPDGNGRPAYKRHKSEVRSETKPFGTLLDTQLNTAATRELREIFGAQVFDYPKTVNLIRQLIEQATDAESIVLDFFSGSATTAQAVMELNASDGGHRKFIMIQLPEETPDKSEARRAGYKTICDIGRERIRRAGDKLKAAHPTLDTGFRTFKVDESNFAELPEKITQTTLAGLVENIKPDRDAWDLLFGALLDMGLTLDLPVTSERLDGFEILRYGDEILACFDKNIPPEIFNELASRKPRKLIFRDASFRNSAEKLTAIKRFNELGTEVKVL